jgi:Domain of unknown function (DUF4382)/Domain of unknown function (DUF5666)
MKYLHWLRVFSMIALTAGVIGCNSGSGSAGSGNDGSNSTAAQSGSVFVLGTDAPLPSVVSFSVNLQSITLSDGSATPVSVLNGAQTVDFARFNGLSTLLDFNSIPAGSYTTATITLGAATIGYLNTQPGVTPAVAPTIGSMPATLTQSVIIINLANPLVVNAGDMDALRFDFDLRKSIQADANGQITGQVTPVLDLAALGASDPERYIDEFDAGVVSIDTSTSSFTVQGPHGRQYTVQLSANTEFENGESITNLTTNSIVQISGSFAPNSQTINADCLAILSQDGYWAAGLLTSVTPAQGAANSFNLYVRAELPASTGLTLGQIANINLTGNEMYFIYKLHTPLTNFLFNSSMLVPGQHISIGGPLSGSGNSQSVTAHRIVLRHEGHAGEWVVGSTNTGNGTFSFNSDGLAGILFNGPVTVYTTPVTQYLGGLSGLGDLSGNSAIALRVVGLVLKDPVSGNPVFVARSVEELQ